MNVTKTCERQKLHCDNADVPFVRYETANMVAPATPFYTLDKSSKKSALATHSH